MGIRNIGVITSVEGTSDPQTFSHDLIAGNNRMVVISLGIEVNNTGVTINTVTYGGETCTQAIGANGDGNPAGWRCAAEIWYIKEADLPTDGTKTVSIDFSGTLTSFKVKADCRCLENVDQDATITTQSSTWNTDTTAQNHSITPTANHSYIVSCTFGGDAVVIVAETDDYAQEDTSLLANSCAILTQHRDGAEDSAHTPGWTSAAPGQNRGAFVSMSVEPSELIFGVSGQKDLTTSPNFARSMGGTMPNTANMKLRAIYVNMPVHSEQLRLAVYQGGTLAGGPPAGTPADLINDFGQTSGTTLGWLKLEIAGATSTLPDLTASGITWPSLKSNATVSEVSYTSASAGAEDYQTAEGRWNSTGETVTPTDTWDDPYASGGSFGAFWYSIHLVYEIDSAVAAIVPRPNIINSSAMI